MKVLVIRPFWSEGLEGFGAVLGVEGGYALGQVASHHALEGRCFILLDVSRWMSMEGYYDRMEQFLEEIKASPLSRDAEGILYPGERRHRNYLENARRGVALPATVRQKLEGLAREYDTEFSALAVRIITGPKRGSGAWWRGDQARSLGNRRALQGVAETAGGRRSHILRTRVRRHW